MQSRLTVATIIGTKISVSHGVILWSWLIQELVSVEAIHIHLFEDPLSTNNILNRGTTGPVQAKLVMIRFLDLF